MLTPLENLPDYSTDIWDYLIDMPYLPSRQDRDRLVKEAESNLSNKKRIQLWDYFFRIKPDDVGKPQKREIAKLEEKIESARHRVYERKNELEGERSWLTKELGRVQDELEDEENNAEKRVVARLTGSNNRTRIFGIILAMLGGFFLIVPLCAALLGLSGESLGIVFACFYIIGLPIVGGGAWILFESYKPSDKKIKREVAIFIKNLHQKLDPRIDELAKNIQQISSQIDTAQTELDSNYPSYAHRIEFLKSQIADLIAQIPAPPSDEDVDNWLREDIKSLAQTATSRSGLRDRLVKLKDAENPFCIRGPAELQAKELIPRPYWDKKSDRNKHLRARHYTIMPDSTFADFYGVYNFEFILLADNVLATYGTIFDFITGHTSGERVTSQDYANVVAVKAFKTYREIETDEGEKLFMENVPSLSLSLTNADKIDITFPDEDYFKQTNAKAFSSARWRFDPRTAAENAIKYVREKADEAQRKREFGS
ncbi:MAG: hypothetical protein HC875_13865 [Anaerolineales bacterium]|nr:hypothetical protein [Anaerolineales bacterium]